MACKDFFHHFEFVRLTIKIGLSLRVVSINLSRGIEKRYR